MSLSSLCQCFIAVPLLADAPELSVISCRLLAQLSVSLSTLHLNAVSPAVSSFLLLFDGNRRSAHACIKIRCPLELAG